MEKFNITEISYKNYNRCLRITNNLIEVIVFIEDTIRIVKYGYINGNNQFEDGLIDKDSKEIIGGHSFSYVPQIDKNVDFIDNQGITYETIVNGVRFIQNIEKWTQIRRVIEIIFEKNSSRITVIHKILSLNAFDINIAICSNTIVRNGGIEVIPFGRGSNRDVPNKSLIFWPYSNLKDSRVYLGDKYVAMKVNENIYDRFRMGINTDLKYLLYYNNNEMFIKEFSLIEGEYEYPNMGCKYESLITPNYLEMKVNSPIYSLSTNNYIIHTEVWDIYRDINLDFIDKFIDQYNK
ncbi:hypothetical protein [Candidatus Arthromitus sp. SFB-rat-Yit]|uniref:hypothetical protein n=1 Tax=Candidatus Arthromitus sp. SFB-rat-Yit TaxID=1041504 RepID=UPI000227A6C6|nr:hypothetical protein [Candidatus Arthromitus sp. SFB-rat-Yit]BAK80643.1 hypothetical protein RATSFB_0081 [Candidatus Arthromitus sp. SFB-rat-Yit]